MFKHILLPTDGSPLSVECIRDGIRFAKSLGARVTGISVMPLEPPLLYEANLAAQVLEESAESCRQLAERHLAVVRDMAEKAGVECDFVYERADSPYDSIIRTAHHKACDLIMMASHGRKGIKGLLLGSETQKVLTHSKIPVLVFR